GVLVQHSTALAFSSLNRFRQGFLLALVVVGLGAILFWYMLSYRVMLPLAQLTRYGENVSQEVAGGEQSPLTITPLAGRQDQIGRLARTLLQAEQSIRRRLMELTTLNKTSKSVVSTLDTQQVINAILDEIQHLFQIRQCALQVITPETEKLTIRASRGLSATYVEHLNQAPVTRILPAFRAIESGQAVQIPDIEADPTLVDLLPLARAEDYRSLLAVPLIAPHVPPAALIIYHPHIYHFTTQEIDLVTNFANYAAIALEHATLFSLTDAELQQQVRFLSALNKVGHTVSQSLLVDDVLNSAIDTVFEVLPIESCWICMYREEEDFMRLRAQRGLSPDLIEQLEQEGSDSDQGLVGHVVRSGQPLLLGQSSLAQSTWPTDPLVTHGDWQFLAVTPLPAKDTTIGVLGVAGHSEHDFAGTELELLQAIGDQIAIAVVNARLYRRSREVATLEERNRVAREIHDTLAQGFTGIIINLQTAERLYPHDPDEALTTLRDACDLARQSLQEARRSVLNLRPGILEALTIDRALAQHLENFAAETGLKTEFKVSGYPSRLDIRTEHNLFRIAQEALTNVKRHARAKQVTVALEYNRASVSLTIADDGIGLNGAHLAATNGHNETHGFGLVGIHERVHQIGGRVSFTPPATGGTQIKVVVDK
nr:GAF domain-containing protein [Anaerolineae bacterium]